MAYRIDFDTSLEQEVRRIAAGQLTAAAGLLQTQPDGLHEAIHDARKHIKRTRALYRLIASGAEEIATTENARLRAIASELSHLRDAAALAESAHYLEGKVEAEKTRAAIRKAGKVLEKRRDQIARDEAGMTETLMAAAEGLRQAEAALADLNLAKGDKNTAGCLAAGWEKTGKKAVKALANCASTDESVPFHDLRKCSQDRWMHATLLRAIWPAAMISIQNQAKALIDLLGHEHDLAVLSAHIATSDDFGKAVQDRDLLLLAIFQQRQKLHKACRDAGKDMFDDRPSRDAAFVKRLIKNR